MWPGKLRQFIQPDPELWQAPMLMSQSQCDILPQEITRELSHATLMSSLTVIDGQLSSSDMQRPITTRLSHDRDSIWYQGYLAEISHVCSRSTMIILTSILESEYTESFHQLAMLDDVNAAKS